ncbi:MAG: DUF58 domain-containing protein [Planctomycetes bacterium]|nr:DUF58 domain-containing protein [Planctomycetota bacterium]
MLALLAPVVGVLWLLASLAAAFRIYPHRPMALLLIVPALLSIALVFLPQAAWITWMTGGIVTAGGAVTLIDLLTVPRRNRFGAEREAGRIASLSKHHPVQLTILHDGTRPIHVWIRDGVPLEFHPDPPEFLLNLTGRSRSTVGYQIRSTRRGAFRLTQVHLRVRSRLGLWQRFLDYPVETTIHVYPDMKQIEEYAVLARTNRLSLVGVRRTRRIGQDNEFERLRDYTPDDNYKHIDWRSTARRRKLTVKDYQTSQSQRLIFLVDCGRMMTNESRGLSLLDHALNAMLMLSYVAISHGDSVGLLCFSDEIHGFVPPRGGRNQMNHLLHASFDRFPRLVESRYDQAFLYLASHCRKRSLVILITNVIDQVNAQQIEQYLGQLVGRHLPMGVLLRDHRLFDAADIEQPSGVQLFRAAAAAEILNWRFQVLSDLNSRGVLSVDVFPEELTAPLVNRYLEIKARHLL